MLARKRVLAKVVNCLLLVFLICWSTEIVNGQASPDTSPGTEDKQKLESSAPEPGTVNLKTTEPGAVNLKSTESSAVEVNTTTSAVPQTQCVRTIFADVVAMPQPLMLNRLGAGIPDGLIFALRKDTVTSGGQLQLRSGKRPRPLVLRANVGDCIKITLTNSIPISTFTTTKVAGAATGTTEVSLHVQGMEWAIDSSDDGSFTGLNNSSLLSAPPPPTPTPSPMPTTSQSYTLFARQEGTFLMYTMGDTSTNGDQLIRGLFGALNVQPAGAEWYRSQVTADDLLLATYNANRLGSNTLYCPTPSSNQCTLTIQGPPSRQVQVIKGPGGYLYTLDNHPLIDYNSRYPATRADGRPVPPELVGRPILRMTDGPNIVHTDLTAMITGPNAGRFPGTTGVNNPEPACNGENNPALNPPAGGTVNPLFCANPAAPDRKQPYREIVVMYHGGLGPVAQQAFPILNNDPSNPMAATTVAGQDAFAINYGTGGIGAEIYANRIGVGPMANCADCKFEEFFLSAWPVGDPAMLVDKPANATPYVKATAAFFPDDPSNVFHSYINDHVKFRILHGGRDVTHVHHQHAHQWLQSPNSDQSSYLDSQMISPGASYTLEMVYNGSGNRNKVVGDSIFHCHFYPHFAAGMWAMWRTHDTFESGTFVKSTGQVVPGSRALPDGEIVAGVPTPAVVPLPTLPMAPLPGYAQIQANVKVAGSPAAIPYGGQVVIGGTCQNNKVNGMDVVDQNGVVIGCTSGQPVYGVVINSQYNASQNALTGQLMRSTSIANDNPGFPYFIPGVAGARAPHPPFDFAPDGSGGFLDGGLPRHVVTGGTVSFEAHTKTDWSKDLGTMNAVQLPETGTAVENAAITYFSRRCYSTYLSDGTKGSCPSSTSTDPQMTLLKPPTGFILNGLPLGPQLGAPFADPAVDDNGGAVNYNPNTKTQTVRRYQGAAFQLDVTFNKKGWHFPQQRMLSLWQDVAPTLAYKFGGSTGRKPEPLFIRGNSGDIIEYWHTNLVPNYYNLDAFQVRTPTDILGQHIHLVKFDVTSSDGAGNGFNYEDGTFSPEEVQDIYAALTASGGSWTPCSGAGCTTKLRPPQPPPAGICGGTSPPAQCQTEWKGAQTTVQRWYLDPLVDNSNVDRTMRTVFTHDHFGPSTHQQAGLYAGLLIEPKDSIWKAQDDDKVIFGSRSDGGPTSWQARIFTSNQADSYREFMLEFQDLQLAYQGVIINGQDQPVNAPSTPSLVTTGLPAAPAGTQSVNYSNDPIAFRIGSSSVFAPPSPFSDLSYVYDNAVTQQLNPSQSADPATPLMRAYQNDKVQVRVLVGAHVFAHQFAFQGPTWFAEPAWKNSGYRSVQAMGLSEHFEFLFNVPFSSASSTGRKCPDGMSSGNCTDYLYSPSFDQFGLANGLWGLFRSYDPSSLATSLLPLPNNPVPGPNVTYVPCPSPIPAPGIKRVFNITAVSAQKALSTRTPMAGTSKGQIVLNDRGTVNNQLAVISKSPVSSAMLTTGIMYVRSEDLDNGLLKTNVAVEPLVLRANAGDCIEVNLTNGIDPNGADVYTQNFFMATPFNVSPYPTKVSRYVGLSPQLLSYDAAQSYGINVGWNRQGQKDQVVPFGQKITYQWYAGKISKNTTGGLTHTPVEFGTLNLLPSDPLFQNINGLFGSMIIEPAGSSWVCGGQTSGDCNSTNPSPASRTSATVKLYNNTGQFREFALMISDAMLSNNNNPSQPITAQGAVNYGTEPQAFRFANNATNDFSCMASNNLIQTTPKDPKTPILTAAVGDSVRFRMAHPFGTGASQVITLHGHVWQRNPYTNDSTQIGNNKLSQWLGSRDNHGSGDHYDFVIDKAGGEGRKAGDYLYIGFVPLQARQGAWGLFRVGTPSGPLNPNARCTPVAKPNFVPPKKNDDLDRFNRPPFKPAGQPQP